MTTLKKDTLSVIMPGTTHVIDMGGKEALIFYENATTAHILLPDGTRFHGSWTMQDDGYTVAWTGGPTASWKLDHAPGAIVYLDATGTPRGRIARIEFGDTGRLAA
jgi:hypothetical protein